jgi:uncharacterized protein YjbI with pentapeptide repeats
MIEAQLINRSGSLIVVENDAEYPAEQWFIQRIARLPLLADRILTHIPAEPYFVTPAGSLLDQLDEDPLDEEAPVPDAEECMLQVLGRRPAGVASVLYLTSDAGEGKTTVISDLARKQATLYRQKERDWLLVPISLGGRTFMRFDDVIIGALVNRLRFPMLYFDAFIELVRMGVIVPAFDGFEEMFVEGTAGDAISALGNLVNTMQSSGTLLIAARKAYFEYKSLRAQTRLFDSLGGQSVTFSRLALERWDYAKFIEYSRKRGITNGDAVYQEFAAKLHDKRHPLLTRAVLVKRLLDVAEQSSDRERLIEKIELNPDDYFRQFVGSIIARESQEKWLDKKGEVAQPLISDEDHYELLSAVALEMWTNGSEMLPSEVIDVVAEMFSDSKRKDKVICHQIIQRLKQHALIVPADVNRFRFDHQEFYHYFLGEAVGQILLVADTPAIRHVFRQGVLPHLAVDIAARYAIRHGVSAFELVKTVNAICSGEPHASFIKDNLGGVIIRFVEYAGGQPVIVKHASMPPQALSGRKFSDVVFEHCYFQTTVLDHVSLVRCRFTNCEFEEIELGEDMLFDDAEFYDCHFRSVVPLHADGAVFAPSAVIQILQQAGFLVQFSTPQPQEAVRKTDEELIIIGRMLRAFMRSSGVNENTLQKRLGAQAGPFFRNILPKLGSVGILVEVPFTGGGSQRRFRLGVSLERLRDLIEQCGGRYDEFLRLAGTGQS